MKNCGDGALMLAAFVTVMVKSPLAFNTFVVTGVHRFNGNITFVLFKT